MINFGLSAPRLVHWLIGSDGQVHEAVVKFIAGQGDDHIDVAGPPAAEDIELYHHKLAQAVPLPCVRLNMRMVVHHLTSEAGVEVTCSDRDLEELSRWWRMAEASDPKHTAH